MYKFKIIVLDNKKHSRYTIWNTKLIYQLQGNLDIWHFSSDYINYPRGSQMFGWLDSNCYHHCQEIMSTATVRHFQSSKSTITVLVIIKTRTYWPSVIITVARRRNFSCGNIELVILSFSPLVVFYQAPCDILATHPAFLYWPTANRRGAKRVPVGRGERSTTLSQCRLYIVEDSEGSLLAELLQRRWCTGNFKLLNFIP